MYVVRNHGDGIYPIEDRWAEIEWSDRQHRTLLTRGLAILGATANNARDDGALGCLLRYE